MKPSITRKRPFDIHISPVSTGVLLALLFAAIVYYGTTAPGVLWQDSGMAQIRVLENDYRGQRGLALSHPLFYLLAEAFQKLPFHDSAYKVNLLAATCGVLTVANLFLLLMLLTRSRLAAVVGALSLLVAHTFWQHSVRAEIYTLTCMLLTAELLCWLQFYRTGFSRWVVLAFFLNGLGCANHLLALLTLLPAGVVCLYLFWQKRFSWPILVCCALVWLIGAGPYEYLIYQELAAGKPIAAVIHSALFGVRWMDDVLNWHLSGPLLRNTILAILINFPTATILLAIFGIRHLAVRESWFGKLLVAVASMHLIFAMRYTVTDQYTFFITTVVFVALLIGVGAWRISLWRPKAGYPAVLLAALPLVIYWQLPHLVVATSLTDQFERKFWKRTIRYRDELHYFLQPWSPGYRGPERFAREVLGSVEASSIVIIDSTAAWPLRYLQITEQLGQDVQLNLRANQFKELTDEDRLRRFDQILAQHPVYLLGPLARHGPSWILENYDATEQGILHRISGRKPAGGGKPED